MAEIVDLTNSETDAAAQLLGSTVDDHGWRARSLVEALELMAAGGGVIEPSALAALVERLEIHVAGLCGGLEQAHGLLRGRLTEA